MLFFEANNPTHLAHLLRQAIYNAKRFSSDEELNKEYNLEAISMLGERFKFKSRNGRVVCELKGSDIAAQRQLEKGPKLIKQVMEVDSFSKLATFLATRPIDKSKHYVFPALTELSVADNEKLDKLALGLGLTIYRTDNEMRITREDD